MHAIAQMIVIFWKTVAWVLTFWVIIFLMADCAGGKDAKAQGVVCHTCFHDKVQRYEAYFRSKARDHGPGIIEKDNSPMKIQWNEAYRSCVEGSGKDFCDTLYEGGGYFDREKKEYVLHDWQKAAAGMNK